MDMMNLVRISRPFTMIQGPEYQTSMSDIEIDISFGCNLKCYNCDRSCTQAPDNSIMSVSQVEKFIGESITKNKKWRRIRILGR